MVFVLVAFTIDSFITNIVIVADTFVENVVLDIVVVEHVQNAV